MKIRFGTNRLVIVGKDYVYKIALHGRGARANTQEYEKARTNPFVAETEKKWYGLKQEKLSDLITLPRDYRGRLAAEILPLWACRLHNRFQVGLNTRGVWRFFDYEEVKYKEER